MYELCNTCYSQKSPKDFNQSQNKGDTKIPSQGKQEGVAVCLNRMLQEKQQQQAY